MTDNSLREEDFKLIIFSWMATVLGIPEKGDPTKYNELTDRLYDLFTKELSTRVAEAQTELIRSIEKILSKLGDDFGEYEALDEVEQYLAELTNKNGEG